MNRTATRGRARHHGATPLIRASSAVNVNPWLIRSPSAAHKDGQLLPLSAYPHPISGAPLAPRVAEGLRMSQGNRYHTPAMVAEVLELLDEAPPGVVVDATIGGGGHAAALLERRADVVILGIDRDGDAVAAASARLAAYGGRAVVRRGRFDQINDLLSELPADVAKEGVAAVLFDLGVSSHQLDEPGRGFSYRSEGPLDMRMDTSGEISAADFVNESDASELEALFVAHGEERFARRIARAIVRARPISSTTQLAEIVATAVPAAARRRGHPARRVFQALRVAVNAELEILGASLDQSVELLAPRGRLLVISYHSGEDRIVKQRFRTWEGGTCSCPPGLPCVCGRPATVKRLTKGALRPSAAEVAANPRAREARLRAVERLAASENGHV